MPIGLNSRWNSTAAAAASPTVTASARTSRKPATRMVVRPKNSALLTLPTKRVNRSSTPTDTSLESCEAASMARR